MVAAVIWAAGCTPTDGPEPVSRHIRFAQVAVGTFHACGLSAEGEAYCWGENSDGQLGDGTFEFRSDVVHVTGGHRFSRLVLKSFRSCGLTPAGELFCWGGNPTAVVAPGLKASQETHRASPVRVADSLTLADVAVGDQHICGLTTAGLVYCWGDGRVGQLGTGSRASDTPARVALDDSVVAIAAGAEHTCARSATGRAWCWGFNVDGRLGTGDTQSALAPRPVAGDHPFRILSAGDRHVCGLAASGETYCWGWNFYGQLGLPTTERCSGYPCSSTPIRVSRAPPLVSLSAGEQRTCGLVGTGQAYCWGGLSPVAPTTTDDAWLPNPVLEKVAFASLSVGDWKICGITTTDQALCFSTRLGLPSPPVEFPIPWKLIAYAVAGALVGLALVWAVARVRGVPSTTRDLVFGALYGAVVGFVIRAMQAFTEFFRMLG